MMRPGGCRTGAAFCGLAVALDGLQTSGFHGGAMVIGKTLEGQRVLKDRSVPMTARQRAVFILVDGKKTLDQLLAATAPAGVTRDDVDKLLELGLVAEISKAASMA